MHQLSPGEDSPFDANRPPPEEILLRVFKQYDIENSGAIEHSTLVVALRELGISSCLYTTRRVLEAISLDKSDKMEFQDFCEFYNKASDFEQVKELLSREALKYLNYKENAENGDGSFSKIYRMPECISRSAVYEHHMDVVQSVSWLNESEFFSASLDGSVAIWRVSESNPLRIFRPTEASIYTAKLLDQSRLALLGYAESESPLNLVDLNTGKIKTDYKGVSSESVVSIDSDGTRVVSGTKRGLLTLHLLDRSDKISTFGAETKSAVESVSLNGLTAAAGDHAGRVSLVDFRSEQQVRTFEGALGKISSVFFRSEFELFVGGDDFVVRCFDLRKVTPLGGAMACFLGHTAPITSLTIEDESGLLFSGAEDGSVRIWSLNDEEPRGAGVTVKFESSEENNQDLIDDSKIATRALIGHSQAVKSVSARPGSVLTGSSDTTVNQYFIN